MHKWRHAWFFFGILPNLGAPHMLFLLAHKLIQDVALNHFSVVILLFTLRVDIFPKLVLILYFGNSCQDIEEDTWLLTVLRVLALP